MGTDTEQSQRANRQRTRIWPSRQRVNRTFLRSCVRASLVAVQEKSFSLLQIELKKIKTKTPSKSIINWSVKNRSKRCYFQNKSIFKIFRTSSKRAEQGMKRSWAWASQVTVQEKNFLLLFIEIWVIEKHKKNT